MKNETPSNSDREMSSIDAKLEECFRNLDTDPIRAKALAEEVIEQTQKSDSREILGKANAFLARAVYNIEGASAAEAVCRRAIDILEDFGSSVILGMAWLNLGNCLGAEGDILSSKVCYETGRNIYKECGNRDGEAAALNGIGISFARMGFVDNAIECYREANSASVKAGNKHIQAVTLNNIADLLIDEGEFEEAREYLEKSLKLNLEIDREIGAAICLSNLGKINIETGSLKQAEEFLLRANSIWEKVGSKDLSIPTLSILAEVYTRQQRIDDAIIILNNALQMAFEAENRNMIGEAKLELGILLIDTNREDEAKESIIEAINILDDIPDAIEDLERANSILAEHFEEEGDLKSAIMYYKKAFECHNNLTDRMMKHSLKMMKLRLEYQSSEMKREALAEKNEELKNALAEVRTLRGLFPICSSCKKIRNDSGYWEQIEEYVSQRSEAQFSHGLCPDCASKLYPEFSDEG